MSNFLLTDFCTIYCLSDQSLCSSIPLRLPEEEKEEKKYKNIYLGLFARKLIAKICDQLRFNQPAQLQRLAQILNCACSELRCYILQRASDKGPYQTSL